MTALMTDDDCDDPDDALRLLLLCLRTQIWNSWFSGFGTAAGRDGSLQDAGRTAAKDFDLNWAGGRKHSTCPGFPSVPAGKLILQTKQQMSPVNV